MSNAMATTKTPARGGSVEGNELATREETTRELAPSSGEAAARYEIEGAMIVAKRFPRNEDRAFAGLMRSAKRLTFAADASYAFPRGGETVEGPSVYLAREAARLWGNIRFGADIISDDEDVRHLRGWAWDMETNAKVTADDVFAKLIYRKKGGWLKPDERDLRELTNRRAAILIRNCILSLLPTDLIEDAMAEAKSTLEKGVADNPEDHAKRVILAFAGLAISVEELERHLGHKVAQSTPAEIAELKRVWKSISDGNSKWTDYVQPEPASKSGPVAASDLTSPTLAKEPAPTEPAADDTAQAHASPLLDEAQLAFESVESIIDCRAMETAWLGKVPAADKSKISAMAHAATQRIRGGRGGKGG